MKKIMILAVAAALLGIAAPNTMAQVPGSSQPSSSSSSTQEDDDINQTPSSTTTQPGTSGSTGTSGTSGTSGSQPGTSGSQSTQPGTSGTQSGSQSGTSGSSGSMGTSGSASSDMEYKTEVKSADLPAAITRSLNERYPGYKTEKAFRGTDGTYKVKVSKGDEMQTLFFDERGEVVKSKESKEKK